MNLILIRSEELDAQQTVYFDFRDRRHQHIRKILRANTGDKLRVGLLNGPIDTSVGQALVSQIDKHGLNLSCTFNTAAPAKLPLKLAIALPRPNMIKRILKLAGETGVQSLCFFHSHKVEASYWDSEQLSQEKLQHALIEGLEQAGDTQTPELRFAQNFDTFRSEMLPSLLEGRQGFIAELGNAQACPQPFDAPALMLIGPEGGFTPSEVEQLCSQQLMPVHFGPRILKVENAVAAAIAKLYSSSFLL